MFTVQRTRRRTAPAAAALAVWLPALAFGIAASAHAELLYQSGDCCIADGVFSDHERGIWQAGEISLTTADTLGGIRFWGVYANATGGFFTSSLPDDDAFTLRVYTDADDLPGTLLGESTLTGTRVDTGMNLGATSLRWYRYDMALDAPLALDAGRYWVSVVNDTTTDTDDDWAWGLTDDDPLHAYSLDDGIEWTASFGNLALAVFDADGVTTMTLTNAVEGGGGQPVAMAEVGERLVYRIVVENPSGVTAVGLVVEQTLPPGIAFVSTASTPTVTAEVFADALRWPVGTLPGTAPDNVFAADVIVDVSAAAGGQSIVSAVGVYAVDVPFLAGGAVAATFDGVNSEAVTIVKTAGRNGSETGSANVGDRIDYAVTVTNEGDAARDVAVTDLLPGGVRYVADSGGYDPGSGHWAVGPLAAASAAPENTRTLTITADVLPAADGELIVNKATISSLDGAAANIFETAPLSVFGADLAVELTGMRDAGGAAISRVRGGTRVFFRFRLTNHGPEPTSGPARIALTQVYSPNFTFDGFTNVHVYDTADWSGESRIVDDSDCTQRVRVYTCPLERPAGANAIAAGETISFEVSAFAAPVIVPDVELTLELSVASDTLDPSPGNDAWSAALGVDEIEQSSGGDGGGGACFIATAAYGSYLEPEVAVLRAFRDDYLLTNRPGRAFVAAYYRHSPALARVVADSPALRAVTRWALTPLVWAIRYPAAALLVLATGLGFGLRHRLPRTTR